MSELLGLLEGRHAPGVYRWAGGDEAELVHVAEGTGWRVARIDGATAGDKAGVLGALGQELGFPDWYGQNLDALADCLADLDSATLLVWEADDTLAGADPAAYAAVLGVLRDRAAATPAFAVLLHGERGDGEVDELT